MPTSLVTSPTPRDKKLSIILILLMLTMGLFPAKMQYTKLKNLLTERRKIMTHLQELTKEQNNLKKFEAEWEKVQTHEEMDKLAILLPQDPSLPDLAVNLEAIAKNSGLILYSFSITPSPAVPGLKDIQAVSLNVSLNGKIDYPLLRTVLGVFEENLRVFDIEGLTFTPSQPSLNLQIKTYFLPPSSVPSPALQQNPLENNKASPSPRYL